MSPIAENAGPRAVPLTAQLPLMIGRFDKDVPQFAIDNIEIRYTDLIPKEVWDLYSDANGKYQIWTIHWIP